MRALKNKWVLFLILIVVFVIIDVEIRNVTLSERGIVLGIGIDKEGEEYLVTTEILAPSNMGAQNYQKNRILSLERGKTLSEAFERMDKAIGVRISLKHTVLIVLGESMLEAGEYGPLFDLFVGNGVSDNTYIVGTNNSAKELFRAKPPLYSTISYKIAETFRSPDIESGMVSTNVKDFFRMYLEESGAMYIPIVEASEGNIAENGSGGEDKDAKTINFGKIGILDRTGLRLTLTGNASDGISYIYSNVNEANLYVGEKDNGFDMDIIDTVATRKVSVNTKAMIVDVKMWVKLSRTNSNNLDVYSKDFSDSEIQLAGGIIENSIKTAYLECRDKGVDILGIGTNFYKKLGKNYIDTIGENYLQTIPVDIRVSLIVK